MSGKTILSPVHKTDGGQQHPRLEDLLGPRDGKTASPDSADARRSDNKILDGGRSKNPAEELQEILQPVPIPINTNPAMAALLAALN